MTQSTAFEILKTGTNVFLTGEPGSGKTYLVNQYIAYLRSQGMSVAITASTGIAATHISGVTIHSWSGIGIRDQLTQRDLEFLAENERLAKKIRGTSVLIIDEISMLDAGTLDMVEQVCRTIRRTAQPFGGLQVVLVGDFFQLPPITRLGEGEARFAFSAAAWTESMFEVCYLTEQHRQTDTALASVLAAIRAGAIVQETVAHLTTRRVTHHDDQAAPTKLYSHNADVDRINADKLEQLPGRSQVFAMTTKGANPKIAQLIRGCLSPERLELKKGAAVMCTRNNPELGFVNGTLGTIIDFDPTDGYPVIKTRHGRVMTIPPAEWAIEDGEKVSAMIVQIPLRLAWAITVHKSQGMSLDAAVMDLSRSFAYGQGYVALSRVRTLEGLFLLGWNDRALMIDPAIQDQDLVMRAQSAQTEQTWNDRSSEAKALQHRDFIRVATGMPQVTGPHAGHSVKNEAPTGEYMERVTRIRQKYPQAYTPWTSAADEHLADLFQAELKVSDIADRLERQPGAIRSRLKHLGLTG